MSVENIFRNEKCYFSFIFIFLREIDAEITVMNKGEKCRCWKKKELNRWQRDTNKRWQDVRSQKLAKDETNTYFEIKLDLFIVETRFSAGSKQDRAP
jgi:hypothetical protein